MEFTELANGNLLITIDADDRRYIADLKEDRGEIESDSAMYEFFEPFIQNGDWDWIRPEECGDLTSAPMLGLRGEQIPIPEDCPYVDTLHLGDTGMYEPVIARWAHMNYAVESMVEVLMEKGQIELQGERFKSE